MTSRDAQGVKLVGEKALGHEIERISHMTKEGKTDMSPVVLEPLHAFKWMLASEKRSALHEMVKTLVGRHSASAGSCAASASAGPCASWAPLPVKESAKKAARGRGGETTGKAALRKYL